MPTWSDLYRLIKPTHGQPIPPIEKGMEVCITWEYKFQKGLYISGKAKFWVKVTDVIGDDIVAKTTRKMSHLKRHQLLIFDKLYIEGVEAGWEYALKHQSVHVSKGVYYHKK